MGCHPIFEHPSDVPHGLSDRDSMGMGSASCGQLLSENDCRHGGISPLFFPSVVQDQPGLPIYPGVPRDDICTERRVVVGGPPSASP